MTRRTISQHQYMRPTVRPVTRPSAIAVATAGSLVW